VNALTGLRVQKDELRVRLNCQVWSPAKRANINHAGIDKNQVPRIRFKLSRIENLLEIYEHKIAGVRMKAVIPPVAAANVARFPGTPQPLPKSIYPCVLFRGHEN
jgi:hypothetical protein